MKIKKETLLQKVDELQNENQKLFNRKAKLEEEILDIDITLFRTVKMMTKILKKLLEK